jgi:hypothetical protein
MICSICGKPRNNIKKVDSKLTLTEEGFRFFACEPCRAAGKEPRWLLILVGRSEGFDAVSEHIRKRLYDGDEISAAELL